MRRLLLGCLRVVPEDGHFPAGVEAEGGIAEDHEFHALEKDAGRVPILVWLEGGEMFVVEVIINGRDPAIAEAWSGIFGVRQSRDKAVDKGKRARLTAGVTPDIGRGAIGVALKHLFAETGGIEFTVLIWRRRGRRGAEDFFVVRAIMSFAIGIDVGAVGRQRREIGCAATSGKND